MKVAMKLNLLYLALAVLGNFFYHVAQKSMPQSTSPMALVMAAYVAAFVLSCVVAPFMQGHEPVSMMRLAFSWQLWLLALGALLIEIAYLMAYRYGGSLQVSSIAVSGTTAVLLIPMSVFFFKEPFSMQKVIGVGVVIAGLYLVTTD